MGLETSTTIAGLNALWPLGVDPKSQGDDHLRLIKSVLKTEFSSGGVKKTAETRNRIVNPAMQISQENGETGVTVNGAYSVDQWITYRIGTTFSTSRNLVVTPNGSKYSLQIAGGAAHTPAAGDYWNVVQKIEGINVSDLLWGTASAKQVIVRFWLMTTNAAGTYTMYINNPAENRSYLASFNVAAVSTWYPFTFVVPGDTTGVWPTDTGSGLSVGITLGAGTTLGGGVAGWQGGKKQAIAGSTNGMVASALFYFGDVGVYLDRDNTGLAPPWQTPDEAEQLRACQRYYAKTRFLLHTVGNVTQNAFPAVMRATPALAHVPDGGTGGTLMATVLPSGLSNTLYQNTAHSIPAVTTVSASARL